MDYETTATPALRNRYRVLAGPFTLLEQPMLDQLLSHLATTGARTTTVSAPHASGVEVWRLRSEMETLPDTARRLRQLQRR
jgi:hypothetical protein